MYSILYRFVLLLGNWSYMTQQQASKAVKLRNLGQRGRNMLAKAGESDRAIRTKMVCLISLPIMRKHFFTCFSLLSLNTCSQENERWAKPTDGSGNLDVDLYYVYFVHQFFCMILLIITAKLFSYFVFDCCRWALPCAICPVRKACVTLFLFSSCITHHHWHSHLCLSRKVWQGNECELDGSSAWQTT